MAKSKNGIIADNLVAGMNRGIHPIKYLRLAGFDDPHETLKILSKFMYNRHQKITSGIIEEMNFEILALAGLIEYNEKFIAICGKLLKDGRTMKSIADEYGTNKNVINQVKALIEFRRTGVKKVKSTNNRSSNGLINGLEYKIGAHGFAYYKSGSDWLRSSHTAKELRL
jgi:hypothetical protein